MQALRDVQTHCQFIIDDIESLSHESFGENRLVRQAVERNLTIIGIAAGHIREGNPEVFEASEELRYAVGLRNRFAHGYGDVINDDVIWETANISIPKLLAESTAWLEQY